MDIQATINLDRVLKSRDVALLTKVCIVKAMVFLLRQKIDAFELWCYRRLLRVPWTARRSNQSILKEIYPEYSLVELMLRLKLQDVGHLM